MFTVLATIKFLADEMDWFYSACTCNKRAVPDSVAYYCKTCEKRVVNVTPRYKIKVVVVDETDSTTFVIFDRPAREPYSTVPV